jgi:hypothetical protein
MSTKTTFKRIALVAVAALTLGSFSAVSASAAVTTARTVFVDSTGSTTYDDAAQTVVGASIGNAATAAIALTTATAADAAEVITVTPTITSAPVGSAVAVGTAGAGKVGLITTGFATASIASSATDSKWTLAVANGVSTLTFNATTGPVLSAQKIGALSLTADKAGKYVVNVAVTSSTGTGTNTNATVTFYVADLYATSADGLTSGDSSKTAVNAVAGPANTVSLVAVEQGTNARLVTVTGDATISSAGSGITIATGGKSATVAAGTAGTTTDSDFRVSTPTAGTVTVSIFDQAQAGIYSTTALATVTITVNSAAVNGSLDAASSTATMTASGSGSNLSADALSLTGPRTANNTVASIAVSLAAAAGTLASTTATTISIEGPGLLVVSNGTTNATGRSVTETGSDGTFDVAVKGDGSSGVATVKIVNGAFSATRTITFYGSVASYTVTAKNSYLAVGVTDSQVFTVLAKDAAGVTVPGATVYVSSSSTATATVSAASLTTNSDGATASDVGATGVAAGSAVITVGNAVSAPTVSATYTLNIVKAGIASVTLSFDKAEYTPGEKATITVTAKNADAALVGDATYATFFTTAGITSSANLNGYTADASVATTSGVKTYTVYMPLAAGPVTISATLGASVATAIQATVVTATTTVLTDGIAQAAADAAAEATDAANAATDAANAAAEAADAATAAAQDAADAVAALSTQVSEMINALKKQITALTNLVIKIQKKVKA